MKRLIIIFILFLSYTTNAQNLVPNPSFENYTTCPYSPTQFSSFVDNWISPVNHDGSPDFLNTCTSNAVISIPNNSWGSEPAATGNAYAGMCLYYSTYPNFREYIEVQLNSPLTSGVTYNVSFKYSLAELSRYSTDDLGIYFSSSPVSGNNDWYPLNVTPQITNTNNLNNTHGWTLITLPYTAIGGEQYMTIGNFLDDASTTLHYLGNFGDTYSYVYLDDFSVDIRPCIINLGNDTTLCENQTLTLHANTPNATYEWQDNSANPTFDVQQQGKYWVKVTTGYCSMSDTILVDFKPIPTIDLGKDTVLCQGESLILHASTPNATYLWQDNSSNDSFKVTEEGKYWLTLTVNNCEAKDTINVGIQKCEAILEVPNIFTPNEDGHNDFFVPIISKRIKSMNTLIFNRWGKKVFETNNLMIEWDGKDFSDGVYFWAINYTDEFGVKKYIKGNVTIIR